MSASPALAPRAAVAARVAVFDLDGTLTARDTLFPFLRHVAGRGFWLRLPLALPILALMALRMLSRQRAKEIVLSIFLRGRTRDELRLRGESFARERLPAMLRPQAKARLAWHLSRGHRCVLATASPEIYAEAWARDAGLHEVVGTRLEFDPHGRATGRIDGENCRGAEKLRRLEAALGELSRLELFGYGDSAADRPFLERCSEAHYKPFRSTPPALDYLRLMRPHQWAKNAFVFVGLIFGHAWAVPELVASALFAAAAFSLAASAVYIVNDYADRERDRAHPRKRQRPLASGRVSERSALALAALLAVAGLGLGFAAGPLVAAIVAGYGAMNLAYSFRLKNIVILDVYVISAGFILRILAGTLGIGIAPSQWLLVCSLFLTLFLGFTKRRSELASVGADFVIHRKALLHYNPALLDKLIGISAGAALMSYSLYTMSPATVSTHGTENLIYTIPFVAYGIFRYLYLLHAKSAGVDASRELATDPHTLVTIAGWFATTLFLIS